MDKTSRLIARVAACAVLAHLPVVPTLSPEALAQSGGDVRTQPGDVEIGRTLLDRLQKFSEPKTLDEVLSGTSIDRGAAERVIRQLISDGKVRRTGDGSKESPYKYSSRAAVG